MQQRGPVNEHGFLQSGALWGQKFDASMKGAVGLVEGAVEGGIGGGVLGGVLGVVHQAADNGMAGRPLFPELHSVDVPGVERWFDDAPLIGKDALLLGGLGAVLGGLSGLVFGSARTSVFDEAWRFGEKLGEYIASPAPRAVPRGRTT